MNDGGSPAFGGFHDRYGIIPYEVELLGPARVLSFMLVWGLEGCKLCSTMNFPGLACPLLLGEDYRNFSHFTFGVVPVQLWV